MPRSSDNPKATTRGITAAYDANELGDVPLAAQLMGSNTELLAAAAHRLMTVNKAPRIDLNCGRCPSAAALDIKTAAAGMLMVIKQLLLCAGVCCLASAHSLLYGCHMNCIHELTCSTGLF